MCIYSTWHQMQTTVYKFFDKIDKLKILNWGYENTFQNPVMECVSGGRHMPAIVQKLSARWCWQKQYLLVPESYKTIQWKSFYSRFSITWWNVFILKESKNNRTLKIYVSKWSLKIRIWIFLQHSYSLHSIQSSLTLKKL